jgi:putative SOS response-associated peptidase YedK
MAGLASIAALSYLPAMCGRFTQFHTWRDIHAMYSLSRPQDTGRNTEARYNIAPTQTIPLVTLDEDGNQIVRDARWNLVPWWAKEIPKQLMINARIETVDTSGAVKDAFRLKRCLIPGDGFYEWTVNEADKGKDPWHIFLPDHEPFSFAGLWAHNDKLDITSCTIITMPAGDPMRQLHDRQPVILDRDI